jgi:sensor c-di-GMP phosphodiesterase-like protein
VIAEGVETAAQLAYLQHHHCDQIQGYYLSRPLPVAELELMFRERQRLDIANGNASRHDRGGLMPPSMSG